jgi:hypothetical protein
MKHWKAMTDENKSVAEKNKLIRAIDRRHTNKGSTKVVYAKKRDENDRSFLANSLSVPGRLFTLAEMRKNGWL